MLRYPKTIAVGAALIGIAALAMGSSPFFSSTVDDSAPVHHCTMEVGGYRISVQLFLAHPFLSEHNKHVSIVAPNGEVLAEEVFVNPGGLMNMYVFDDEAELIVMDGMADAVTVNRATQATLRAHRPGDAARIAHGATAQSSIVDGIYGCRVNTGP